jgi:hypothetical protein
MGDGPEGCSAERKKIWMLGWTRLVVDTTGLKYFAERSDKDAPRYF